MQVTKKNKYIIFLALILLFPISFYAQEIDTIQDQNRSNNLIVNKEKKAFKLSNFFKKKNNDEELKELFKDDFKERDDSIKNRKKEKGIFSFLKKNKTQNDLSEISSNNIDSTNVDSVSPKKKFSLFNKNKKDTSALGKPQKLTRTTWIILDVIQQDSLLNEWDDYDLNHYKKKKRYTFSRNEIKIALTRDRNFYQKIIYNKSRNKPFKFRKKLISGKNGRIKKAIRFEQFNRSKTNKSDSISGETRYLIVNKQYKIEAKREAIRKNNVIIKYDRKEDRLKRKYELSGEEIKALNKGRGMRLKGTELALFNKAKKKQEKYSEKMLKLRKNRNLDLQNKQVRNRMKIKERNLKKGERSKFSSLFNWIKRKNNKKHDSDEYPKRYF